MNKIPLSNLRIERLKHRHNLNGFESYEQELASFLKEEALDNQNKKISVTYLFFCQEQLTGHLTLLTNRIRLEGNLKRLFRDKGINYSSLPALKIGRLCVDNSFLRRGVGTLMILGEFHTPTFRLESQILRSTNSQRYPNLQVGELVIYLSINKAREIFNYCAGCRFITLDAKNNVKGTAIDFYNKLGFKMAKNTKKDTIPMYLDVNEF